MHALEHFSHELRAHSHEYALSTALLENFIVAYSLGERNLPSGFRDCNGRVYLIEYG